jgi:hypothetical protein
MENNFVINLRGEGAFFPKIIQTKNPLNIEMTILDLYNTLIKAYRKILPQSCVPYIYVMFSDDSCGFVPLPYQTLKELYDLYSGSLSTGLTIKITDKPFYG